jgi:biofilm PGA synthesis lipoprotein PgaB
MAMPYLEDERHDPQAWLAQLVERVAAYPMGLRNTVFELQSVDWARQGQPPVPGRLLAQQMQSLRYAGAQNFGYYPDDFLKGNPPIDAIRPWLSVKTFPGTD